VGGSAGFGAVEHLAVTGDGSLYATGMFETAGDVSARNIARWDGAAWHAVPDVVSCGALATGADGLLRAACVFQDNPGRVQIARWNGATWQRLGGALEGDYAAIYALAAGPGESLYAGGRFTGIGGKAANNIARWDGAAWQPLGAGLDHTVLSLALEPDGLLYAGGSFQSAGGVSARRIAQWDGRRWTALGDGVGDRVDALAWAAPGTLFAGGPFTEAGGRPSSYIAVWTTPVLDKSLWLPLLLR